MTARRVSAYGRIEENRRATRLLLVAFAVLLVPVLAFLTAYLGVWLAMYVLPGPIATWLTAQALAVSLLAGLICWRVLRVRNALPETLGAIPLPDGSGEALTRRLANLALGAGLPTPRLLILKDPGANALACGPDPERASVVLTSGLIETLGPRELDGVLAHELAHIANGDIRLNSTVAAILATARLPTPVYWVILFGAAMSLASLGEIVDLWRAGLQTALNESATTGEAAPARWIVLPYLFGIGVGLPATLVWPAAGRWLQAAIARRREHLADAEAVRLTRDPMGLASALTRMAPGRGPRAAGLRRHGAAVAHLCIAPLEWGLAERLFPTHPPIDRRIALLKGMGAPEPLPLPSEAPAAELVAPARAALQSAQASLTPRAGTGLVTGFLVGWGVCTALFALGLGRLSAEPAAGVAALAMRTPFGFAGAAAAYAALRVRRRFYWWPIIVMFVMGPYLPVSIASGVRGAGPGAVTLAYLAALTEPLAGAALGAFASVGFAELTARAYRVSRGR